MDTLKFSNCHLKILKIIFQSTFYMFSFIYCLVRPQIVTSSITINYLIWLFIYLYFQHIILVLKMLFTYAIPSQPQWITEEVARLEFQRREALKVMKLCVIVWHQKVKVTSFFLKKRNVK